MRFDDAPTVNQATVSAVPLRCPAWWALDLTPLWRAAELIGEDIEAAGTSGNLPRSRRKAGSRIVTLEMRVSCTHNRAGAAVGGAPLQGLEVNEDDFRTNIMALPGTVAGTRPIVCTKASGATVTGDVHPELFELVDPKPTFARAVFQLSIAAGELT